MEATPVLWDKTDVIYKEKIEKKKAWKEVCVCLQVDFEDLGVVKKDVFAEYCQNLLNKAK